MMQPSGPSSMSNHHACRTWHALNLHLSDRIARDTPRVGDRAGGRVDQILRGQGELFCKVTKILRVRLALNSAGSCI